MVSLLLLALPAVVFFGGAALMAAISRHGVVEAALLAAKELHRCDREPLNRRIWGYDVAGVDRHWKEIKRNPEAEAAERLFLKLDLVFPLLYGGAFAASLLIARSLLQIEIGAAWVVAPIGVAVAADWIENLIHLRQLAGYEAGEPASLDEVAIGVAGVATSIKLLLLGGAMLALVAAVVVLVIRGLK
jgi:hypothetical protein